MTKKLIVTPDGVQEIELTGEELTQRETDIANDTAKLEAEATAKTEKDALKASAKAKLIAGEAMTEEEANVLVGV